MSTQTPPQSTRPPQLQVPAEQVFPGPHWTPQSPQFCGSVAVLKHFPLHSVVSAGHVHVPATQAKPLAVSQALPQTPQLSGSVLQSSSFPGQQQLLPGGQGAH